jgi:hypothetical protein
VLQADPENTEERGAVAVYASAIHQVAVTHDSPVGSDSVAGSGCAADQEAPLPIDQAGFPSPSLPSSTQNDADTHDSGPTDTGTLVVADHEVPVYVADFGVPSCGLDPAAVHVVPA